ncbi:uncharacterized protein LOC113315716 [Papaver somniferum]|uniref:uncharacterized protein LOC113315716 n=1 Tax=Papaver somniferum TaxID=3469 RepID=UPI000E6FF624|nr:uncharacterized protein LOC113315716 [Papaver somniferum]
MSSKIHKYIITATEYTTKWVEAILLKDYAGATIAAFIKEYIICRFGAPMIIRADNAKSFVNKDIIDLLRQYNVRLHTSTPYYPQGKGQAEASNKTFIRILSRTVEDHHREWHEQLPLAVWAYRISKRSSTGASPYSLVYGEDAILPAEIVIPSARVAMASHMTPDKLAEACNRLLEVEKQVDELKEENVNLDGELAGIEARHEAALEAECADWTKRTDDLHAEYGKKIKDAYKAGVRRERQRAAATTSNIVTPAQTLIEEPVPAGGPSEGLEKIVEQV